MKILLFMIWFTIAAMVGWAVGNSFGLLGIPLSIAAGFLIGLGGGRAQDLLGV